MADTIELLILIADGYSVEQVALAIMGAETKMDSQAGCDRHNDPCTDFALVVEPVNFKAVVFEAVLRRDYVATWCEDPEDMAHPVAAIIGPSTELGPIAKALLAAAKDERDREAGA